MGIKDFRMQFFGKVLYRGSPKSKKIALTFDDGPDPNLTPDILKILKMYSAKATFFVVAARAAKYPDILKQCYTEGHTIACHDLTHSLFSNFRTLSPFLRDISKAQDVIMNIINKKPLLYRPPEGLMNPHLPVALKKLKMQCIGWSKSTTEAGNRRLNRIKLIKNLSSPGEVILLHDILPKPEYKQEFLKALDMLSISIRNRGLETVGVEEMFDIKAYE